MIRRRVKVYEAPSPEERRRLEAHRLDALEQHMVRAHTDRRWPTAEERLCPTCEVRTATKLCWMCGADLSVLPATQGAGTAGPVDAPSAVSAPVAAGPGTNSRPAGSSPLCTPQAGPTPGV